jgi:hypothetical protein
MIDELRELLVQDEGMVLEVYLDHLGFSTAGCGHFLQERDPERGWPVGMAISQERADQWLEKDMKQCVSDAHWLQPDFDSFPVPAQITVASSGVPVRDHRNTAYSSYTTLRCRCRTGRKPPLSYATASCIDRPQNAPSVTPNGLRA